MVGPQWLSLGLKVESETDAISSPVSTFDVKSYLDYTEQGWSNLLYTCTLVAETDIFQDYANLWLSGPRLGIARWLRLGKSFQDPELC